MLTARTRNGKKLCLGYPFKKETLLSLRNREEFFCPVCGEKVILKLGDQKVYHFAHQKGEACREFYENETEYHMEGKRKLFQWLGVQKVPAELEYYDRDIGQRPDILFHYQGKKYALEFQCSPISQQSFCVRTNNYLKNDYIPLWIIGGNNLQGKFVSSAALNSFHYLFLRKSNEGKCYIPCFSPDKKILQIMFAIFPYSIKNTILQKLVLPIEKVPLSYLLNPPIQSQINASHWKKVNERYILNWSIIPSDQHRRFLNEIYNHRLNLYLFPPEIGVPVSHGFLLRTPPFMWQTFYYLDILQMRLPGDFITLKQIEKSFTYRIKSKDIQTRSTPQIKDLNPFDAFIEYTYFLVNLGLLSQKSRDTFQVQNRLAIPRTNREKEQMMNCFYQGNHFEK